MNRRAQVMALLERVASALGPDLSHVVFVGGVVPALYAASIDVRMTDDVDLTVDLGRLEYEELVARLRKTGFRNCIDEDAPTCRYELGTGEDRVLVDVMPADPSILGFSNRWYAQAAKHPSMYELPSGKRVRAIAPLPFLATKLDAFHGRGEGNYGESHDLGDILHVLAAMPELLEEIAKADDGVTHYLSTEIARLAADRDFVDAIAWHFPGTSAGQEQAAGLADRLTAFAHQARAKRR